MLNPLAPSSLFLTFIPLSEELKNSIQRLLEESSHFNANDVLVNAQTENKKLFFSDELSFGIADFPKRILTEAKKTHKEAGVNSLCLASDLVEVKIKETHVNTPIFLHSLSYAIDKVRQVISFTFNEEEAFLNPFLVQHLKNNLGIEEEILNPQEKEQTLNRLTELGLKIDESHPKVIGNFHHHRFQIVKELEELLQAESFSNNLSALFGEGEKETNQCSLPKDILLSADTDHEKVFEKVQNVNTVIQGPPGTGKSQVLTNLIAKNLAAKNTSIVVSEKRVALEVLVNKLSAFGLDKYCFIASSDNLSHTFLQELKSTWDYLDTFAFEHVNNLRLSEQYLDHLQMTLDLLSQKELIGGVSFSHFKKLSEGIDLASFSFSSNAPEIGHFLANENTINEVYKKGLFASVGRLKKSTVLSDDFNQLDQKINDWISSILALEKAFNFSTWEDFNSLKKEAAICQVFENDLYKKYAPIFKKDSKAQKRFLLLRKKHAKLKLELEKIQNNTSQWKVTISESETKSLLRQIKSKAFFGRVKTKKRWKEISTLPYSEAQKELEQREREIAIINDFSQNSIEFCEISLENPELDVPLIAQTLYAYSDSEWKTIAQFPEEKKSLLTNSHAQLSNLQHELKSHFNFLSEDRIVDFLKKIKQDLGEILPIKESLKPLDKNVFSSFLANDNLALFKGQMLSSNWTQFKVRFPAFSEFSIEQLKDKINDVINAQKTESKLFAKSIENSIYKTFVEYNELLTIPARKLSEELKAKKVRLRKGKSLLIKEFSKTRSHPSLRELQNSEAREWIQLLKPIWLSNPTQVGKCFPMEKALFDVAIFDEASQIPLQNALGTIQRSQRIVVAGDEHQMGPSSYFSTGNSEQLDLLHQANYYWEKVDLKHHYRSLHPDLIAFSNKHFYKDELKAFPANNSQKALHHHFCENALFIERKNEQEAIEVAKLIEKQLLASNFFGVVAFSEEQLNCIWSQLSAGNQQLLVEKTENNLAFFKSLENVQGDECDILIISFGYAKNSDGEFHMRFGPMNTLNGRKRLNVLLTRARKELHFFCSVKAAEFKISDNESINLLKKWVLFSESKQEGETMLFPFDLQPKIKDNTITFSDISTQLSMAEELVTLQNVLEQRAWETYYS